MKKIIISIASFCLLISGVLFFAIKNADAAELSKKLAGKILLQVESHGEAWYVHPIELKKLYMANGEEAYNVMRDTGVGISNNNLTKIKNDANEAKKHAGKIFLQVEDKGQAYYINFDGKLSYLKNGDEAYKIMKSLALGITNKNLEKIESSPRSTNAVNNNKPLSSSCTSDEWICGNWGSCSTEGMQSRTCLLKTDCPSDNSSSPILAQSCEYTETSSDCTSWAYSPWGICSSNGSQKRTVISSFPTNCSGGSPLLTQSCTSEYSPFKLGYQLNSNHFCGTNGVRQYFFEMNTNRDIIFKKVVVNALNMSPEQIVGIKIYPDNNVHSSLQQINSTKWETNNTFRLRKNRINTVEIYAGGSCGLNATINPIFSEWVVWDETSDKPVLLKEY